MKNKNLIIFLVIILGVSVYFNFLGYFGNDTLNLNQTLECFELWEHKKDKLFGSEIGNYSVIYNNALNTCLVGNIYDQEMNTGHGDKYFVFVVDLMTDEVLLNYLTYGHKEYLKDVEKWEKVIKKYKDFGLNY